MGTNRLAIYNNATRLLGSCELSSLTENNPIRRRFDSIWDDLPLIDYCLEQGFWRFARRSIRIYASTDIDTSEFGGYQYAFELPSDAVGHNNIKITTDEYFKSPILDMQIRGGYLFCDYDNIYIHFVSNNELYGGDLTLWTPSFADYVASELAYRATKRTTESGTDEDVNFKKKELALKIARNKDALRDPVKFKPEGSWTRARRNSRMNGFIISGEV